ncbi:MAG: TerB family tellurite resistance protein [Candidatus Sulfomarinibacteraceae bacterium]
MISFLNKLFGREDDSAAQASSDTETVRRIVDELDRLDPDEARYLASFAFVLARVAYSDSEISCDESRRMEEIVRDVGGLTDAQAVLVVQIAKSQQLLKGGTENYLVTREFGRIADREQKERLLHCLFETSAADNSISLVEEDEIKAIAAELKFEHKEFSAIRSKYNRKRSILK